MIPFVDLDAQFQSIRSEVLTAINEVLESKNFIQGPVAEKFARHFCEVHGAPFGVGCSNGTTAITLALKTLDLGPGDAVLAPNNTFIGTVEPIHEIGAEIILVDIDPETYGMDLKDLERKITKNCKAIIPVHLYGNPENMPEIMSIANKHNLAVIEDCAQAHLARINNKPVGTFGSAGTFSFYPGKNLGAYGDAGFVLSTNENIIGKIAKYLDHGRTEKYTHEILGVNARIDAIQAAVLDVKCKYIKNWTHARREKAEVYNEILGDRGFKLMKVLPGAEAVYHLFVVEVSNRADVMEHLKKSGISSGIHYPVPLSHQPALMAMGVNPEDFPVSANVAKRIMSLPIYPEISELDVKRICKTFLEVAKS